MRSASLAPALPALMALLTGAPSWAGSAGSSVTVGITLSQPGGVAPVPPQMTPNPQRAGVCFSRTLSEQTGAVVQVACDSGQFVSIEAVPGQRFLGVHDVKFGVQYTKGRSNSQGGYFQNYVNFLYPYRWTQSVQYMQSWYGDTGLLFYNQKDTINPSLRLRFAADRPSGPAMRVADVTRLHALGFTDPVPLDEGLRRTVAWRRTAG